MSCSREGGGGGGAGGGGVGRGEGGKVRVRGSKSTRALLPSLKPLSVGRRGDWPKGESEKDGKEDDDGGGGGGGTMEIRERFAYFDKECSRITEHIYLGSDAVARNRATLRAHGITHVLNCVGFVCPEYFKKELVYKTLWLQDSPAEDITSLLYDVFDYFEEVRELAGGGGRVFVHCCQGVSRSTSLVIAYLMWLHRLSFEQALSDVRTARGITNPNMGFACQLLQCQKRVHSAPLSPASAPRIYRIAPHSAYAPLHLVPKPVHAPLASALDSRTAFVIHLPDSLYVWMGLLCPEKTAQSARSAADQLVHYESAHGPAFLCKEGDEPSAFWESLGKCSFLDTNHNPKEHVEKVRGMGPGEKRVPEYDIDIGIYERASYGGVFPPMPSFAFGAGGAAVSTTPVRVPAREDGWSRLRRKLPWVMGLVNVVKVVRSPSSEGGVSERSSSSLL